MRTIWKYPVRSTYFSLPLRKGAKVLDVQIQHGLPWIWALVDTEAEVEHRIFRAFCTGHEIPQHLGLKYVGTLQGTGGWVGLNVVLHLFEEQSCHSYVPIV